ncbi:MAG: polysaccharide deacetylase family protein [Thermomicrobiales bacterium]
MRGMAALAVGVAAGQAARGASAQNAVRVPVLCYHNIDYSGSAYAVTPELLESECQWLITNGYTTISVYQLYDAIAGGATLPANPVVLTNDDGWSSSVTFAQTLNTHGMIGNYFINNYSPISAADIQFLLTNGPVQAHTASHQHMPQLDPASQLAEITSNQAFITGITGQPVQFLAWPFGEYGGAVQTAIDAGILGAFALGGTPCYIGGVDPFAIPRIMMEAGDTLDTFAAKVNHW